jgi:hypothetical protein
VYNAQQQYANVQSSFNSLLNKLNSVSFPLSLLETWSSHAENANLTPVFLPHLKSTITSCEFVISGINAKTKQTESLSRPDKLKALWNNDVIKAFEADLDSHIQALTLLLHTMQL